MKRFLLSVCALLCVLLLAACGEERPTMEGWYLQAENGTHLLVTEDGEPITLSHRSGEGGLFDGLTIGDRMKITYDGSIAETWPGQIEAWSCELLEEGAPEAIPAETLAALEDLGYTFDFHTHTPADEPLTVEDPVSGYCGNTVTTVTVGGMEYTFWGSDSVTLMDILINLAYDPDRVCRCMVEYTVDTEFGSGYGVNLTESYARYAGGQAPLTMEQAETIRDILTRNCGGVAVTQYRWEDETHGFSMMGDAAAALTELFDSLTYSDEACDSMAEYTVRTASDIRYDVHLTGRFVRQDGRQAELTEEQAAILKELFDRSGGI